MQARNYTIQSASLADIPSMLGFEKKYFDACWQADPALIDKLIHQDPMMFRLCKKEDTLKGYYGVMALPYQYWDGLLKGSIEEAEALQHTIPFEDPDSYLYIFSLIVDMEDAEHKEYTRALIRDFARQYIFDEGERKPHFNAAGAFTVSAGGTHIVERSGFDYLGSFPGGNGEYVKSYAIKRQRLIQYARQNCQCRSQSQQK